jgi:Uma2 family endonuclease
MDVYLDEHSNAVQPDIIILLGDNVDIVDPQGHIHSVPDILIEILSPGNKDHDLITKKDLYARFGVKEYWIIDPKDKLAVGYKLENKTYTEFFKREGSIHSRLLDFACEF